MIPGLSAALSENCAEKKYDLMRDNFFANFKYIKGALGVKHLKGKWKGRRAIVAGAGPSLDADRVAASELPIIACDRAVRPLLARGRLPDFVVSVEVDPMGGKKLEGLYPELRRVPLAFDPLCCPRTVREYLGPRYTWDKPVEVKGKGELRQGTGVVTYAVGLAEVLGASEIILSGVDLAYPDREMHAEGVTRIEGEVIEGALEVESVRGFSVMSDAYLACNIEELSQAAGEGVRLIQTSPAGARIPGAIHQALEAVL